MRLSQWVACRKVAPLLVAAMMVTGLTIGLSACSQSATSRPPTSVAITATDLAGTLRETPGLARVKVTAAPLDDEAGGLDGPQAWIISVAATVRTPNVDIRQTLVTVESQLVAARRSVPTTATLRLVGDGFPRTTLEFESSRSAVAMNEFVSAVTALRPLAGVRTLTVVLGDSPPTITVSSPSRWPALARHLRALSGFGHGLLAEVNIEGTGPAPGDASNYRIAVGPSTPDEATMSGLARMLTQRGVTELSYSAVRPRDASNNWRPFLTLDVQAGSATATILRRLTGVNTLTDPRPETPRTRFQLTSLRGSDDQETDGYLGLPLGSAEPDDLAPAAVPAPVDGAIQSAKLSANVQLVRTLLDEAGQVAGIRGTPIISTMSCAPGPGTRVAGSVLIPIFEIASRADPAYAAITATWTREGYTSQDKAAGTELRTGGPLEVLSIEGTPDGLSITATSYC